MILDTPFYQREDVVQIAKDLLGCLLVSDIDGLRTVCRIVETEAYRAPEDRASHAFGNRHTTRTATMYESGGVAYVYLCYGIHHLFNVVTASEGQAHAVLIRAVEPSDGVDIMMQRRGMTKIVPNLTNGPGKFTKAMGISIKNDRLDLTTGKHIWIEKDINTPIDYEIISGYRVGIHYAQESRFWPWRFQIKDSRWTSKPLEVFY